MPASTRPQLAVTDSTFYQRFSATPRGARLARLLTLNRLDAWGIPHHTTASDNAAAIVAELAANAVTHGRVPGRDFALELALSEWEIIRIEVTDTRTEERRPVALRRPALDDEYGRGLQLVEALASGWGVKERLDGGPGKSVWATVSL
jgi:anti-sigma regulatory factor (Ser/Thr protein kinase)